MVLEVDVSIKRIFKQKKFLSSQTILKEEDNLFVSYKVTNDMEILPLIGKWLPNIKIISPESTKEKFLDELKLYLNNNRLSNS